MNRYLAIALACLLGIGFSGCDKIKEQIRKAQSSVSSEGSDSGSNGASSNTSSNDAGKETQAKRGSNGSGSSSSGNDNNAGSKNSSSKNSGNKLEEGYSSYRNEPIAYGKMKSGQYTISLGQYKSKEKAEERSRELRKARINNYIYFDEPARLYYIMVGNYVSQSQAERQVALLQRQGYSEAGVFATK